MHCFTTVKEIQKMYYILYNIILYFLLFFRSYYLGLALGVEKNHFQKYENQIFFYLNQTFFKFAFSCQVFTKFLKLVCLLNHTNNTAATILLFPVIFLSAKSK